MKKILISIIIATLFPLSVSAAIFKQNQLLDAPYYGLIFGDGFGTSSLTATTGPTVDYITATNTAATSTIPTLIVSTALSLFGTVGSSLSDFCVAITGGSGLCDGSDDGASGNAEDDFTLTDGFLTPTTTVGVVISSSSTVDAALSVTGLTVLSGAINASSSATSTFAQGINLDAGCFAISGTCLSTGGSSASSTLLSDNNTWSGSNTFPDSVLMGNALTHAGDTDTQMLYTTDQIQFNVGGVNMLTLSESTVDLATFIGEARFTNGYVSQASSTVSAALTVTGDLTLSALSDGCLELASSIITSTGADCGSGGGNVSGWATTTAEDPSQLVLYTTNSTDIVAIGSNATATAEIWADPNTQELHIGNGTKATSSVRFGESGYEWTVGSGTSTRDFVIASSTDITGVSHMLTLTKAGDLDIAGTATSTYAGAIDAAGDIEADQLYTSGATSTFANGLNLLTGCLAVAGTCINHDAVTVTGEDFLSLSGQQITANAINPDNLASTDFGDFTCNGTTCSLDATYLTDITGENIGDLADVTLSATAGDFIFYDGTGWIDVASTTLNWTDDDITDDSIESLSDVASFTQAAGDFFYHNGSTWDRVASSSLSWGIIISGSDPTVSTVGHVAIDTATSSYMYHDGTEEQRLTPEFEKSFPTWASTTVADNGTVFQSAATATLQEAWCARKSFEITDVVAKINGGTNLTLEIGQDGTGSSTVILDTTLTETDITDVSVLGGGECLSVALGSGSGDPVDAKITLVGRYLP